MKNVDDEIEEIEQGPATGLEPLHMVGMQAQLCHSLQHRRGDPADVDI